MYKSSLLLICFVVVMQAGCVASAAPVVLTTPASEAVRPTMAFTAIPAATVVTFTPTPRPVTPTPDATRTAARRILFTSKRDGTMQLFVMNDDGSNPVRLTDLPDWNGFPSPSPDGKLIAFVSETRNAEGWPKDQAIFVIQSDGSHLINLQPDPAPDLSSAWSPDSTLLAFASAREGDGFRRSLYLIRPDGTGLSRLVENGDAPVWSPGGKQIAFMSDRDTPGSFQIYVINSDGSGLKQLTSVQRTGSAVGIGAFSWSPDGARIVFFI